MIYQRRRQPQNIRHFDAGVPFSCMLPVGHCEIQEAGLDGPLAWSNRALLRENHTLLSGIQSLILFSSYYFVSTQPCRHYTYLATLWRQARQTVGLFGLPLQSKAFWTCWGKLLLILMIFLFNYNSIKIPFPPNFLLRYICWESPPFSLLPLPSLFNRDSNIYLPCRGGRRKCCRDYFEGEKLLEHLI